jgi:hypothetical protein
VPRPSVPARRSLLAFVTSLFTLLLALVAARPAAAQGSLFVFPDGQNVTQPINTTTSASFGLTGLVSGQTYFREITCTGQVTSCSTSTPDGFTAPLGAISVSYTTTSTGGAGRVMLKVYGNGSSDTGWVNVTVDNTPPTIALAAPSGFFSTATPTIQLAWCDNTGLNSAVHSISVNGVDKTSSFDYVAASGTTGCAGTGNTVKATSTTSSVSLNMGNNTVAAHICDTVSLCKDSSFTIVRSPSGVAVRSELGARQNFTSSTLNAQRFFVKNTQNAAKTFTISANCPTPTGLSACVPKQTTMTNLQPGESRADTVTYSVGASGGTIYVKASDGTFADSAAIVVTAVASPAPLVSVLEMNPGTAFDRGRCVTIAVAQNMANECGDLRVVHVLPAITTLGRTRAPALLYNSANSDPIPIVAASVTLTGITCPNSDSVEAVLTVNGTVRLAATRWAACNWANGTSTRRIGVGYDASGDTTGVYDYTLQVTKITGATRSSSSVSGKLIVVNRNSSAFGAGWWLAGLERLELRADGSKLWVGGDGSARLYSAAGANKWAAPPMDGPDTLTWDGATYYTRTVKGGTQVKFNSAGQHVLTINRIGQQTAFGYTSGRLTTITLPSAGGGQTYTFNYDGSNKLANVDAPRVSSTQPRIVTLYESAAGRVDSIADPDANRVRFAYANGTTKKIGTRRNRLRDSTIVNYETDGHIYRVYTPIAADSIKHGFLDVSLRGYYNWWVGKTAYDTASAATMYYQPRTYAARASDRLEQRPMYFLNGDGSLRFIYDAAHKYTRLSYEDAQWPALVTQVTDPTGFTAKAGYDGRGNVVHSVGVNAFGVGKSDTTLYAWDPVWDAVTRLETPMHVVTTMQYDVTTGNRLWQQVGSNSSRRVTFNYNAQSLPSSIVQQGTILDSLEYDSQRNLFRERTALNYWTSFYKDALGRDTLVVTPIDSGDHGAGGVQDTMRLRNRVVLTVMDRDSIAETIARNGERVYVRKLYDAEGNALSLARIASPDLASIDSLKTF